MTDFTGGMDDPGSYVIGLPIDRGSIDTSLDQVRELHLDRLVFLKRDVIGNGAAGSLHSLDVEEHDDVPTFL